MATTSTPGAPAATASPTIYFVVHAGSITTALGKTAFGPIADKASALKVAQSLARGAAAQVYAATLLQQVQPVTPPAAPAKPANK